MPEIKEFDVVIKRYTVDDLKQLLGQGIKDVRVKVTWNGENNIPKTIINSSMELVVETWEPKKKELKS